MKKLKQIAGESLVEMLCSMLIISLGMLIFAGAVTASARVNQKAHEMMEKGLGEEHDFNITIDIQLGEYKIGSQEVTVISFKDGTEVYYYAEP